LQSFCRRWSSRNREREQEEEEEQENNNNNRRVMSVFVAWLQQ
jgi:hypothetical protein